MYKQTNLYVRKTLIKGIVYNFYFSDLSKPWIILLSGLPQYIFKQNYLKTLIETYSIIAPYYPGSFHSYKRFSLNNILQTTNETIKLIENGEIYDYFENKKYKISNNNIDWIFGLSFGANVLFDFLLKKDKDYLPNTKFLLVSPMFNVSQDKQRLYWKQKLSFLSSKVYSNIYRGINDLELITWFSGLEQSITQEKNGIVLYGREDIYIDKFFLKEKFPNFKIIPVNGYSHEVDKLVEYFIPYLK
jgi:hypothetical protein